MQLNRILLLALCVGLVSGFALGVQPDFGAQQEAASEYEIAQQEAASEYEITIQESVDISEQTINFSGRSYSVSSIGRRTVGSPVNVSIDAPENTSYAGVLVNANGTLLDVGDHLKLARGASRLSFNTSDLSSGTYFVAVKDRTGVRKVQPVVVTRSEVSLSGPDCVVRGSNASFQITTIERGVGNVSHVELVAFGQNRTIRATAERERTNLFIADLPLEDVPSTDLLVYATVYRNGTDTQATDDANLRNLVGISEQASIFVVEDEASCG